MHTYYHNTVSMCARFPHFIIAGRPRLCTHATYICTYVHMCMVFATLKMTGGHSWKSGARFVFQRSRT